MAGSRRNPVLRDEWSAANNASDHDRQRPRHSRPYNRDRGRDKHRERDRPPRPKYGGSDRPLRSPPPSRAFAHPGRDGPHKSRDLPIDTPSARSPGPSESGRNIGFRRFSQSSADHPDYRPWEAEKEPRRDDSPSSPPPSKRKRTRSPSPGRPQNRPPHPPRHPRHHRKHGEGFDRGPFPPKRGRFPGRGRGGRGPPRRGRDRRRNDFGRVGSPVRDSLSPGRGRDSFSPPPRRWSRSPHPEDEFERDYRHRSMSRHSTRSVNSRVSTLSHRDSRDDLEMNSTRPMRLNFDSAGSPSPSRPGPDADNASVSGDGDAPRSRTFKPLVDARHFETSPQYTTSNSPRPTSPYSLGRGPWGGQPPYNGQQG